ncbi:oligosaccharide flippase family protein [Bradyrhizobium yuanmingense]|uniref:oligosaccharide flippase family protein n=1 Tax=Bradyrhizobium yuanmingense TaxID=108015 RepID=UPI0023B9B49B|nr:oligosaccharide flippase family protein [Bradyrhizobium yuanmingense]MDF0583808.1 oligosaccharide flippase family protein [Bradyrhizobium yuanmingense]
MHLAGHKTSDRLGRSLIASGVGPFASQAFAIALIPLLFRLYTPDDFGVWAAIQAVAITGGSLLSFRFDLGLVLERNVEAASHLLLASIGVVCLMSIVAGIFAGISVMALAQLGVGPMFAILGWAWLSLVGLGVVLQAWLMRDGAFAHISIGVVLNATVANLVQLGGGLSGNGVWLVVGSLAGQAVATLYYALSIRRCAHRPICSIDRKEMLAALLRNRRFVQFSLPFTVMSLVRERVPIFIVGGFCSATLVGLYSQSWRLTHFPSALTSAALRPVFFHRAATCGLAAQVEAADQIVRGLLIASSSWIALLAFGGDDLFVIVLGPQWSGAGFFAGVLSVPAALFMITNWMDRLLDVIGRQDLNLKLEALAGISSVGGLSLVLAAGHSLAEAVAIQATMLTLSYLAFLAICYQVAGWRRAGLAVAISAAGVLGALIYLTLNVLGSFLDRLQLLGMGAFAAGLMTAIVLWRARRAI